MADARRTAEGTLPGRGRGRLAVPPVNTDDGVRVVIVTPGHFGAVRVAAGRVLSRGTSAEFQRLVGLTVAAFRAYAAARGWRLQGIDAAEAAGRLR